MKGISMLSPMIDALSIISGCGWLELPASYAEGGMWKGAGHKYIKRVPTGKVTKTGKIRYRYFYHAAHGGTVAHQDHFVVGASFRDDKGHWHITGRDGDKLTLRHDETGEERGMTTAELHAHLADIHRAAIEEGRSRALSDLATAHANGASKRQIARLVDRATRTGATIPGGQHGNAADGGPGLQRPDADAAGGDRPHDGGAESKPRRRKVSAKAVSDLLGPTEATASPYLADPEAAQEWVPVPSPALTMHEDLAPTPTVKLPEHLKVFPRPNVKKGITQLFGHQIDGAERALTAFQHTDGIVISDDAGLGKTNTGMATLLGHGGKRNLIVVPTNGKRGIMRQWRETAALYGVPVTDGPPTSPDQEGIFLVSYDELVGDSVDFAATVGAWHDRLIQAKQDLRDRIQRTKGLSYYESYDERQAAETAYRDTEYGIWQDAKADGLEAQLQAVTTGKKPKKVAAGLRDSLKGNFDLAIFDEAHSMANADGQRAKAAMDLQANTGKAVYLSATPFTTIANMHYLTKLGMFADREEYLKWATKAGARVKGNVVENPSSALPMAAIAATMHVDGTMLKRTANLKGQTSAFRVLDDKASAHPARSPDAAATFEGAERVFAEAADARVLAAPFIKAFRSSWARQYWETLKVDEAIEQGRKALAEGKQVAFFTSYKGADHAHLRALVNIANRKADDAEGSDSPAKAARAPELRAAAEKMQRIIESLPPVEPAIKRLVAAFGGVKEVAEIHGDTNKKPEDEQALYQSGARKVVVATMARGGTGISLHDDQGIAPRVQINLSLPWSGREFNQVAGRSHRLGSRSNTTMHWLVGDDDTEKKNATIVAKRLKSMGSLTVGDPEVTIEAKQLANFDFGETLDTSLSDKEIADAALSAEGAEDDAPSDEASAARGYFREFALARKAGRNVISEEYDRRKLAREKTVHAAARKALVQLATRWPDFALANRFRPRSQDADDFGAYAVDERLKRQLEKATGDKMKGRTGSGRWYIDPDELPKIAGLAGVHRLEVDHTATKALAESHARYNRDASDLKDYTPAVPAPYVEPPKVASPHAPHIAALAAAGLTARPGGESTLVTGPGINRHSDAIYDAGGRWDRAALGHRVPTANLARLAGAVQGAQPTPGRQDDEDEPPPVPQLPHMAKLASLGIHAHTAGDVVLLSGNTYAHKDQIKFAGARWDGPRKAWTIAPGKLEALAKNLNKGSFLAPLVGAFA